MRPACALVALDLAGPASAEQIEVPPFFLGSGTAQTAALCAGVFDHAASRAPELLPGPERLDIAAALAGFEAAAIAGYVEEEGQTVQSAAAIFARERNATASEVKTTGYTDSYIARVVAYCIEVIPPAAPAITAAGTIPAFFGDMAGPELLTTCAGIYEVTFAMAGLELPIETATALLEGAGAFRARATEAQLAASPDLTRDAAEAATAASVDAATYRSELLGFDITDSVDLVAYCAVVERLTP